jgi:hypothetical protein
MMAIIPARTCFPASASAVIASFNMLSFVNDHLAHVSAHRAVQITASGGDGARLASRCASSSTSMKLPMSLPLMSRTGTDLP